MAQKIEQYEFEYLFVDDGYLDGTAAILTALASTDQRVKVLHFARNRGHQPAITVGTVDEVIDRISKRLPGARHYAWM